MEALQGLLKRVGDIMEFNTALLHRGFEIDKKTGATLTPIYQVSAFSQESAEQLEKVFNNKAPGFAYTRISNPTVSSFESRIASIENGIGAIACSSGMAAVTMSLKFVEHISAESVEPLINDKTKAVFTELIGNPKLDIVDIKEVSELVHKYNIPLIIDSTTATSYLIRPIDFGADIVIHSSSKYINGGGNSISGIIVDSGNFKWDTNKYKGMAEYKKYGKFAYLAKLRNGIWRNVGCCLSPFNAFLNSVGLETLGLRMERICDNALKLAEYLSTADGVEVNYPALESSPYYPLAKRMFNGKGGAILTIRAGSKERAFNLINNLKYSINATNIGDVRTLVIHPSSTIYAHSTEAQKQSAGVYEDSIRVSIGIEDIKDLIEDFEQAINKMNASSYNS